MSVELAREVLGWCTVMNFALLLVWWIMFIVAHDWIYGIHRKWFALSVEKFDEIHYAGMALYKVSILLLNLVPYLALCLVG